VPQIINYVYIAFNFQLNRMERILTLFDSGLGILNQFIKASTYSWGTFSNWS